MSALNRRAILAGAASLPITALPAMAESDPIFAAIERHRELSAHRDAILENPELQWSDEADAAADAECAAADALFDILPTTVPGVAALLRYLYEFERAHEETFCGRYQDKWAFVLHGRAAEALERIA
jgi:hypothetical protein